MRGARVFHPRGVAFEASWEPVDRDVFAATGLAEDQQAIVRLSKGVGLPDGFPDILGIAIKVLDAHGPRLDQDLLLASAPNLGAGRRMLWLARDFTAATFSSVLAYQVGSLRTHVVARVLGPDGTSLADVRAGAASDLTILLDDTSGRHLARVRLGSPLGPRSSDDLRFDPWHAGPGLRPVGLANRVRRPAYRASQGGRGAPREGARDRVPPTPLR